MVRVNESEKNLERKLRVHVENLGGVAIKLVATHFIGLPDRLVLLPEGRVLFAEVKTTGKKPTKRQLLVHRKLQKLGFPVVLIDESRKIKMIASRI